MDFFAHGAWSYIFFNKTEKPWKAILFGLLPDIISWVIPFFYFLFSGNFQPGPPNISLLPSWISTLYGIGHSIFFPLLIIIIIYLIKKSIPIYIFAWPIAIIMDLLTHSRDFLPTPFLWPLSEWHFPGIRWGTLTFMLINWVLIISFIIYINKDKLRKLFK